MADKPILVFPIALTSERTKGKKIVLPYFVTPSKAQQVQTFDKKFSVLNKVFTSQTSSLNNSINGLLPEMVLVFEIAGSIDEFFKAVERTPGLEYLLEFQSDFLDDGSGYYLRDNDGKVIEKRIEKRIFVSLTNKKGIDQLLLYWKAYKYGKNFVTGTTKFKHLFNQLIEIRPYSLFDRLRDTGFEKYLEDAKQLNAVSIKFEIEFTFYETAELRNAVVDKMNSDLENVGGGIVKESVCCIPEIKYFGIIAEAPIDAFQNLNVSSNYSFLQSHNVLFFKPVGQSVSKGIDRDGEDLSEQDRAHNEINNNEEPIVALLDGMPLENHSKLSGSLIVDDPDNFSNNYLAASRVHSTSMASLILHGDFDNPSTIKSKLYVRPILQLISDGFGGFIESLPENLLIVDLVHRSIVRMFDGENPVAPSIKIINFSIGDEYRPFLNLISTWAKLLDYLSFKYKVLFIISAGNYSEDITLPYSSTQFEALTDSQRQTAFYNALFDDNFNRKILTPSESINALTVGGIHMDNSILTPRNGIFNPCSSNDLPSLFSRIGFGFNRSLKPEILFDGGRCLYGIRNTKEGEITVRLINGFTNKGPGIKTAIPGQAGKLDSVGFSIGTSNSAALISNKACKLFEILEEISSFQSDNGLPVIPNNFYAVLIKTLLVHYADTDNIKGKLSEIIQGMPAGDKIAKEYVYQNVGYGLLDKTSFCVCNDKKVTVIGFGILVKDEGHVYKFPIPDSISGHKIKKSLKISMGWLSPINFNSGKYKMAQISFDNIKSTQSDLMLDRSGADYYISRRGTIQHDVLKNENADAYIQNSELVIKVNCMENACGLKTRYIKHQIEYGIAVTFEIDQTSEINIYEEVKARIRTKVKLKL